MPVCVGPSREPRLLVSDAAAQIIILTIPFHFLKMPVPVDNQAIQFDLLGLLYHLSPCPYNTSWCSKRLYDDLVWSKLNNIPL